MSRCSNVMVLFVLAAVMLSACRPAEKQETKAVDGNRAVTDVKPAPEPDEAPPEQKVVELAPPKEVKPTAIPEVLFSDTTKATCKVGVGDAFPDILGLPEAKGKRLTIVAFVAPGTKPMSKMKAQEILDDVQKLFDTFKKDGLNALGVHVGDGPKPDVKADFTLTPDPDGKLFETVATDAVPPRLFILDSAGKILWMDVEWSNTTRERLRQSVELLMKN